MALRSKTNQKRWMALDWASYCHRMPQETVWSSAEIWMNQLSVFVERRPGFNEFQTKETEIEKARDAKAEETVGLWIWNCWWWMKDDFSCVAGCWFRRTSCYAENNIKCPALKAKSPILKWICCLMRSQWRERVIRPGSITVLASRLWTRNIASCCNSPV